MQLFQLATFSNYGISTLMQKLHEAIISFELPTRGWPPNKRAGCCC